MKPKAVPTNVICSECGLDWNLHKKDAKGNVALDECVRLLKIELSIRPVSYPVYIPYRPWSPYYQLTTWAVGSGTISAPNTVTPSFSNSTPRAIAA